VFVLLADGDIRAPVFRVGYFLWFVGERDIGQGERDGTALRFSAFRLRRHNLPGWMAVSPCASSAGGRPRRYPAGRIPTRGSPRGRPVGERSCSLFAETTRSTFRLEWRCVRGVTNVFTKWINLESFEPTGAGISAELINCGENRQNGEADETK
jgi:hypothetical protein